MANFTKEVIDKSQIEIETAKANARKEFAEEIYNFFCIDKNWSKLKDQWLENGSCPWLANTLNSLANGENVTTSNDNMFESLLKNGIAIINDSEEN